MAASSEQQALGIVLTMDASGMVTGASLASGALDNVKNKARGAQQEVDLASQKMANSMKAAGGLMVAGIAALGAGAALNAQFVDPMIEGAKVFEVEMAQLAFVTKASGDELERLRQVALRVGVETQFAPEEAARAIRLLKASGLSTEQALLSLRSTLDLVTAAAGDLSLQVGAETAATALIKFQKTAETSVEIMDAFAQATRETKLQFRDLPIVLRSLRTAPSDLKLSAAQTFALAGALKNAGLTAAQAGNAISGFGRRMAIVLGQAQKQADKTGISLQELMEGPTDKMPQVVQAFIKFGVSIFDSSGKLRDMTGVFSDFVAAQQRIAKEGDQTEFLATQKLFGSQSKQVINAISSMERGSKKGAEAFQDLVNTLGKVESEGVAREAAAAIEGTAVGLDKFIEGSRQTIAIIIGSSGLLGVLHAIQLVVRDMTNAFLDFVNENPSIARAIGIVIALISMAVSAMGVVALGVAGLILWETQVLTSIVAMGGFTKVLALMQATMLKVALFAGPVFLGILAVMAIVAAGVKVWNLIMEDQFGDFGFFVKGMVTDIKLIIQGLVEFWDGEGSLDLLTVLDARGLTGFVVFLGAQGKKIVAFFTGIGEVAVFFGTMLAGAFLFVIGIIGNVVGAFFDLFKFMGVEDRRDDIKFWKTLGQVLGFIASIAIPFMIAHLIRLSIAWATNAVVVGTVNAALRIYSFIMWVQTIPAILASAKAWIIASAPLALTIIGYTLLALAVLFIVFVLTALAVKFLEWIGVLEKGSVAQLEIFSNMADDITSFYGDLISDSFQWGADMVNGWIDGVSSAWEGAKGFFSDRMQDLRDMMPGSDAKVGPLSDLTASGKALLTTLQLGIDQASPGLLDSLGLVASAIGNALTGQDPTATPSTPTTPLLDGPGIGAGGLTPSAPGRSISVVIQKMELIAMKATPEEAERLARMIMDRIADLADEQTEVEFA